MASRNRIEIEIEAITKGISEAKKSIQSLLNIANITVNTKNLNSKYKNITREFDKVVESVEKSKENLEKVVKEYNNLLTDPGRFTLGTKRANTLGYAEEVIYGTGKFEEIKGKISSGYNTLQQEILKGQQKLSTFSRISVAGGPVQNIADDLLGKMEALKSIRGFLKDFIPTTDFEKSLVSHLERAEYGIKKFVDGVDTQKKRSHSIFQAFGGGIKSFVKDFKSQISEMMYWQAAWYGTKALLFTPIQILGNAISKGKEAFVQWEQSMKNSGAVSEYTAEEMKKLGQVTKDIGATTPVSAKEAAKALLEFAQAGMSAAMAEKSLPIAAKLVVATQEDITVAVKALTTSFNAWNLTAGDMPRVGDAIAASMAASALKVEDLATIFNYLATQAAAAKLSIEDTLTLVTLASKAGVKPSTIGTGISQAIASLINIDSNHKLQSQLKAVGVSIDQVRIPGNNFLEVLIKLKNAGFDLQNIFNGFEVRAGRSINATISQMAKNLESVRTQIKTPGLLDKMFGEASSGLQNQGKMILNQLENIAITIGTDLTPAIKDATVAIKGFVDVLAGGLGSSDDFATALKNLDGKFAGLMITINFLKLIIENFFSFITFPITFIFKSISGIIDLINAVGKALRNLSWSEFINGLQRAWSNMVDFWMDIQKRKLEALKTIWDKVRIGSGTKYASEGPQPGLYENDFGYDPDANRPHKGPPSKEKTKARVEKLKQIAIETAKTLLDIEKSNAEARLNVIDEFEKRGWISAEDYARQKVEILEELKNNSLKFIQVEEDKVKEAHVKELEQYKDDPKMRLQIEEKYKVDLLKIQNQRVHAINESNNKILDSYVKLKQQQRELYIEDYKAFVEIENMKAQRTRKSGIWESDEKLKWNDYYYEKNQLASSKYFKELYNNVELNLQHDKKVAEEKLAQWEADNKELKDRAFLGGDEDEFSGVTNEAAWSKYRNAFAKAQETKNDEDIAAEQKAVAARFDIIRKQKESIKSIYDTEGLGGVWRKSLEDMKNQFNTEAQDIKEIFDTCWTSISDGFQSFFLDVVSGKLKTFKEYALDILNEIYKSMVKLMTNKMMEGILGYAMNTFGNLFGGTYNTGGTMNVPMNADYVPGIVGHTGGVIGIKRFHTGGPLLSDERLLIGQTGEGMVSRKGMRTLENINNGNLKNNPMAVQVNIENKSSNEIKGKQGNVAFDGKSYVVGIILEDLNKNGPLRGAFKGLR